MDCLRLENVRKSFDGTKVIDGIGFSVREGGVTGLVGPNGAGKTTLFNLINGFLRQDTGSIHYRSKLIDQLPTEKRALLGIGRLWQELRLFGNLTALENVLVARRQNAGERISTYLTKPWRALAFERQNVEFAERLLSSTGLYDKRANLARDLSYGQLKLLALARLLANDPQLLLLDEPLAGLSGEAADRVLSITRELADQGKTLLIIEHDSQRVMNIVDCVVLLRNGRIQPSGPACDISGSQTK